MQTCSFQILSRILEERLQFSFMYFLHFLRKGVTSAIFKQGGNEDDLKELLMFVHNKSAKMPQFSLMILIGMFESWETLF